MQSLIQARKLESYLEHHRKFHFGIYAMSGIPLLVETIENMWLRCGPVLSFVIPEYVVLLKGWDHHTAALKAIVAGDAARAEAEIVADITEAAHYLGGLADVTGQLRRPADSVGWAKRSVPTIHRRASCEMVGSLRSAHPTILRILNPQ